MSAMSLDAIDRRLLDALQGQVPLTERPFAAVGDAVGIGEAEVLQRLVRLRGAGGVIRQISAIFDSRRLGYDSCLVGAQVDEERIDAAAAVISGHPGVSHNYRRDHAYNLWYTVTVPPDSRLGLAATVERLHALSGARVTRLMTTLKLYKIGVRFDLSGEIAPADRREGISAVGGAALVEPLRVTERDKRMIRALQGDLPLIERPFDELAAAAGVTVDELLEAARRYLENGVMRRMAAVLRHRQAGFGANAMGAWIVPVEQQDRFGALAAGFEAVSHCYLRPTYEDWPYTLFTMVHGRDKADCEQALAAISALTGVADYTALYSTHEYKKVRVRYMTDDIARWEERDAQMASPLSAQQS